MKRILLSAVLLLFTAALASADSRARASSRARYRIDLRSGGQVLAQDQPVHRGSIWLFHAYPAGTLTGLPEETVLQIEPATRKAVDEAAIMAPALQPGEVIFLGPTAGDQGASSSTQATATSGATIPGGVYDPRNPAFGYSAPRVVGGQTLQFPTGALGATDLARAVSGPPPTTEVPFGSNGFTNTTGAPATPIGPNGFPVTN